MIGQLDPSISSATSMQAADTQRPELLIVDDDPLITDTLSFVLSKDYNVRVAESRAQVRSLLRQLDSAPGLALIDLGLPPTPHRPDEGFQLISDLLAFSPSIKILVLSGQATKPTLGTPAPLAPWSSLPSLANPTR
jgi:DNA-binding NarL/FixJ family response regulator